MHDESPITVVFVSVMALVLPTLRDHSADTDIGLTRGLLGGGFNFIFGSLFYLLSPRIVVLWQSIRETVFLG